MLQLSQLSETLGDILNENNPLESGSATDIIQQLSEKGMDLSYLSELNTDQIMEVINNAGLDVSNFEPHQITEALQHFSAQDIDIQGAIENTGLGDILDNFIKK